MYEEMNDYADSKKGKIMFSSFVIISGPYFIFTVLILKIWELSRGKITKAPGARDPINDFP